MLKKCSNCKIDKDISEFHKNQGKCKDCQREYLRQHYLNNKSMYPWKTKSALREKQPRVRKPITYEINKNGCWECTSHAKDKWGYPVVYFNKKTVTIARYIYITSNNIQSLPSNTVIRHKCDNPLCINLDHLEIGSPTDNVKDRVKRNRSATGERNGRAKLTSLQVKDIRDNLGVVSINSLARKYNVNSKVIYKIRDRVTWKNI
jgi:hypothetical protein